MAAEEGTDLVPVLGEDRSESGDGRPVRLRQPAAAPAPVLTARRVRHFARLLGTVAVAAAALGLFVPWPAPGDPAAATPALAGAYPLTCLDADLAGYGDSGHGWTGGDSTWSAALPGGREVLAFSDTFLPPIDPPSRPADAGFVHNSFVVRDAQGHLSTLVGGTADRPAALLSPSDPAHWFWLGAATYLDGALQVPLTEWRSTGPGSFDIGFVGSSVARFDERDLRRPASITPLPRGRGIQWGQWIQPEHGWTYVYGVESAGGAKYLHVARVSGADLRNPLSFWTGHGWSDSEADSVRVLDAITGEFSVQRLGSGVYMLVTMNGGNGFGDHLIARYGPTPMGPFGAAATLYATPEAGPSGTYRNPRVYAYNAHVHPELSTATRLVVSYNVNSVDTAPGGDVYRQVSIYRPRFVTVALARPPGAPEQSPVRAACP